MSSFDADALYGSTHVEEELQGEIISLLLHTSELACLSQHSVDASTVGGERHCVHLVLAQLAEAIALQQ